MWLLSYAVIKVNPCMQKGPQECAFLVDLADLKQEE